MPAANGRAAIIEHVTQSEPLAEPWMFDENAAWWAKIRRANTHRKTLAKLVDEFEASQPYTLPLSPAYDRMRWPTGCGARKGAICSRPRRLDQHSDDPAVGGPAKATTTVFSPSRFGSLGPAG
jgi:hypothetical protein